MGMKKMQNAEKKKKSRIKGYLYNMHWGQDR